MAGSATEDGVMYPPFRFSQVEAGLFRGAYPMPRSYPLLRRLGLRTLVSLTAEVEACLEEFCERESIRHIVILVPRTSEEGQGSRLTHEQARLFLETAIDAACLPLYVHCLDGCHTTGRAIMCLRKLQLFHFSFSSTEYERFLR